MIYADQSEAMCLWSRGSSPPHLVLFEKKKDPGRSKSAIFFVDGDREIWGGRGCKRNHVASSYAKHGLEQRRF